VSITNRLIIAIDKVLDEFGITDDQICLVNTVHDSIAYEVHEDYEEWFLNVMKTLAAVPVPQVFGHSFKLDTGVGNNWTEAELA
jgi:DNA polymerase I-like protein with 3'-5' exonuclease and polymerase domains